MYFSVGILYSAHEFLRFLFKTPGIKNNFPEVFHTFNNVASPNAILEVCQRCEWIRLNVSGDLEVTEKGVLILETLQIEKVLRIQVFDLIEAYRPNWTPLLSRGRSEALKYLPIDVVQCLREADLTASYSDEVIIWWDKISKISRKLGKDEKLDIGRKGEKLSIEHERNRTEKEPIWQGFESNFSGFDILSVQNKTDLSPLMIEVKSSNLSWGSATFHISKNEWGVAQISANYYFHLWLLLPQPKLYLVRQEEVAKHVPFNQGQGQWSNVEVPFSAVVNETNFVSFP